jgi:hypothetical protein
VRGNGVLRAGEIAKHGEKIFKILVR